MDIRETSPDGRVVWVDFRPGSPEHESPPAQANVPPPGSRRGPPGNPDVDGEALARSLDGLDRAGGGV
jgi:hypothetical protein